jgi:hypothetical protein
MRSTCAPGVHGGQVAAVGRDQAQRHDVARLGADLVHDQLELGLAQDRLGEGRLGHRLSRR